MVSVTYAVTCSYERLSYISYANNIKMFAVTYFPSVKLRIPNK